MTWIVTIRARAEADIRRAREWYDRQRAGLGEEFLTKVRGAILRLRESPDRRPLYYRGFRRLLTKRFPYKLFYRIQGKQVIVFRILHSKRDHPHLLS